MPKPLGNAQRQALEAAELGHVTGSEHSPTGWYIDYPDGLRGGRRVSATVEALIRAGLLDVGFPLPLLSTPRVAMLTGAGRRALAQERATG